MTPASTGPLTLYPDRRPAAAIAILGVIVAGTGGWLAWRGWTPAGLGLAGLGLVLVIGALVWLIPSRAYLHLTDRGFIFSSAFNPRRVDWADVERFGVVRQSGADRVAWDYAPHYPADLLVRERCKRQTGFEAVLPSCCRMGGGPLAELLDRHKRGAARKTSAPPS